MPSALILGYMFWWCGQSNKAQKSGKKTTAVKLLSEAEKKALFSGDVGLVPWDYKPKIALRKSYTKLSRLTGLSRDTVIRAVKKLRKPGGALKVINETKTINRYELANFPFQDVLEEQKDGTYALKTWLKIHVSEIEAYGPLEAVLISQIRLQTSEATEHGANTWWSVPEHAKFHIRKKAMSKPTIYRLLTKLRVKGILQEKVEGRRRLYRLSLKSHQPESQIAPNNSDSSLKTHQLPVSESQIAPPSM